MKAKSPRHHFFKSLFIFMLMGSAMSFLLKDTVPWQVLTVATAIASLLTASFRAFAYSLLQRREVKTVIKCNYRKKDTFIEGVYLEK